MLRKNAYVIVRTDRAGVHLGYLDYVEPAANGYDVVLKNTRRVYSWQGANTLSELGHHGSKLPERCEITLPIPSNRMMAIEIIEVTPDAQKNLEDIPYWKYQVEN